MDVIRVLLVAPSQALRAGLRALLAAAPATLEVVGEAAGLGELSAGAPEADVLLLAGEALLDEDLLRPVLRGEGRPALLLLADEPPDPLQLDAYQLRAWGLLSGDAGPEELGAAVLALHSGLLAGDPALMRPLLARIAYTGLPAPHALAEALTEREAQVLQRLAQGLANKQIAVLLGISEHTVKFHVSSIYAKLGAANRTEAVRLGIQRGLVIL